MMTSDGDDLHAGERLAVDGYQRRLWCVGCLRHRSCPFLSFIALYSSIAASRQIVKGRLLYPEYAGLLTRICARGAAISRPSMTRSNGRSTMCVTNASLAGASRRRM